MNRVTHVGYDLIGDIHGCATELKQLLSELGYSKSRGVWCHPERCAVFVGDLVDRQPGQREVIQVVHEMVERGSALICAGNHELNAVGYATPTSDSGRERQYLRPHTAKNYEQHSAFLNALPPHSKDYKDTIKWFCNLPLWLELKTSSGQSARVIHACWDTKAQDVIKPLLAQDDAGRYILGESFDHQLFKRDTPEFEALEVLLKGRELKLPSGVHFTDKSGIKRYNARVRWWIEAKTWREALLDPIRDKDLNGFDLDTPLPPESRWPIYQDEVPVFIGHYWRQGRLELMTPKIACLDWSVAKRGRLVAYRWNGESTLNPDHFCAVWAQK